jgi:hypothetical protein
MATSLQGSQGFQGTQGRQGTQGAGVQGRQGTNGLQGTSGAYAGQGLQGPNGPQGTQGPAGPSGGGGAGTRATVATTTTSLANGASATATVAAAKGYALYSIQVSAGAWVTVYTSSATQSADSSRTISTDPTPGSGVIAEAITTSANTTYFTPAVIGFNADGTPSTNMYLKIVNNSGSLAAITVTVTYLKLEN